MEKQELRKLAITRLQKIADSEQRQIQVALILDKFFQSNLWKDASSIGVTMATQFEFPTSLLIQRAFEAGKKVAVPKSLPKGKLEFHWVGPDTAFATTKFGVEEPTIEAIAEPDELDLLIVPGLVYKRSGYRVGFGGGYYDRYLANYHGKTCSLVFAEQLMEGWQTETFDQQIQQLFLA